MLVLFITAVFSFLVALLLTPVMIGLARRIGLVDEPDPTRKLHKRAIPLGGGMAVFLASLAGILTAALLLSDLAETLRESLARSLPLLAASIIICCVGLFDDYFNLRGRQKFAGQVVAVAVLIASGLIVHKLAFFGWEFDLGPLAIPFTAFWLLGAVNALNLLDGADGFATTIGMIICGTIGVMAAMTGHPTQAVIAWSLAGALLGFLIFNYPPAKIFLGDTGSMLIGLAVGAMAIRSSLKGPATIALVAPLAILAIPIFDSGIAIARRWLTGRPLISPDRAHLHHNLARRGFGPRGMLALITLLCAVTAGGALLSVHAKNEFCALASALAVLLILVTSKIFGFSEFVLAAKRTRSLGWSLLQLVGRPKEPRHEVTRLQGSREWEIIWMSIVEFAQRYELLNVRLSLTLPWLHEEFHAKWDCGHSAEEDQQWRTSVPFVADHRVLGRLDVMGELTDRYSVYEDLSTLSQLLELLEPMAYKLTTEPAPGIESQSDAEEFFAASAISTIDSRPIGAPAENESALAGELVRASKSGHTKSGIAADSKSVPR